MTNSNGNNSDRLDRIEAILESIAQRTDSNARAIQAMIEQRATDRLNHEARIEFLTENQRQIIQTQTGITNLVSSLDEDRPTILRKLTAIESKVDDIIERGR